MGVLDGIRVVDLTRYLSGPTATMMLADMGADVIKVEGLPGGDPARQSGKEVGGETVYFLASNRNKRSLALNLRTEAGRALCRRLISRADVVVENFKPGVVEKMGLDWTACAALNERLVYCSITGFGRIGIGASLPGFDQTVQAMSGLMSVTGTSETGPLRVGIAIADSATGVFSAYGIVAALFNRERSGRGQFVDCSLMASMLSLMSYQAQRYLSASEVPGQDGNDHPIMFPQGTFRTQSGAVTIACGNEDMWRRLCIALSLTSLSEDERFKSNALRMENRAELRKLLEAKLGEGNSAFWLQRISEAGVPCGPVLSVSEALEHQVTAELGMVRRATHSSLGTMRLLGRAVHIAGDDGSGESSPEDDWLRLAPPLLGEHSAEICREARYSEEEIASMLTDGIIKLPARP
ncbi:MAG: CoA transferase [Actinomycetota bacterium]|jgi:crotonobetainyl-CoA:carnitine CoA-transferase CaiB-like acyl-CoA transferase|nr:CoA transferase [Actinomycetota bacterium]